MSNYTDSEWAQAVSEDWKKGDFELPLFFAKRWRNNGASLRIAAASYARRDLMREDLTNRPTPPNMNPTTEPL